MKNLQAQFGYWNLAITSRNREAALYRAPGLGGPSAALSIAHSGWRAFPHSGSEHRLVARYSRSQQAANLHVPVKHGPGNGPSPVAVKPAGQKPIRLQRTQCTFRGPASLLENLAIPGEFVAGDQTAQHISQRVGQRVDDGSDKQQLANQPPSSCWDSAQCMFRMAASRVAAAGFQASGFEQTPEPHGSRRLSLPARRKVLGVCASSHRYPACSPASPPPPAWRWR